VETFLEWEENATAKKEILKKRITTIEHPNTPEMYFSFHSENERDHYLTIGYLDPGMRGGTEFPFLVFDRENAEKFKNLLLKIPDPESR
jgi:hypothetical protein